jgi:hypothetical protein
VLVVELEVPPPRVFTFVVLVSVLLDEGSFSFTTVVLLSFFSPGGVATVVSFCSQAASRAAPAKIQMIVFIVRLDVIVPKVILGRCLEESPRPLRFRVDVSFSR